MAETLLRGAVHESPDGSKTGCGRFSTDLPFKGPDRRVPGYATSAPQFDLAEIMEKDECAVQFISPYMPVRSKTLLAKRPTFAIDGEASHMNAL
jgi:hypothetical protein